MSEKQPEQLKFLPAHFEAELRAFVSSYFAHHKIQPQDVVEKLHRVADAWSMVKLQIHLFDPEHRIDELRKNGDGTAQ